MRDERVNALLVGSDESPAPGGAQGHCGTDTDEILRRDHPRVDGGQHGRVCDEWAELLEEIERQRGAAEAWLMVETDERIEADGVADDGEVLDEEAVRERQERVHRVAWWAPVPVQEVELRSGLVLHLDHAVEMLEVQPRRRALDTEQRLDVVGVSRVLGEALQPSHGDRGRLLVVPLEERPLVSDLRRDDPSGDAKAELVLVGASELITAQKDVLESEALREAVEPAAEREVGDGFLRRAQPLHRRRRQL